MNASTTGSTRTRCTSSAETSGCGASRTAPDASIRESQAIKTRSGFNVALLPSPASSTLARKIVQGGDLRAALTGEPDVLDPATSTI